MIFGSADGMFQRSAGLAVEKRQAPVGDSLPAGRASPSRSKGGTHPGRISLAWNVVAPMGSGGIFSGKPTVRKAQLPSGHRMIQKAKAGSRKATGNRVPSRQSMAVRR
ncbi:hypothetical protein GCM10010207_87440 [Streptomyces atratus]|nr:hypothetical protein GCM10010207_87440 [Streptomyces atratus]